MAACSSTLLAFFSKADVVTMIQAYQNKLAKGKGVNYIAYYVKIISKPHVFSIKKNTNNCLN